MNILVTEDGRVQNLDTGNWLGGDVNNCGYKRVQIKRKRFFIHRLVAECHLPNPEGKTQVNHIDGDKQNNHVSNLEWASPSENQTHRYYKLKKGLGELNANSKLTAEQVISLREAHENGQSGRSLAREYGVSQTLVRAILARKTWKHI